MLVVLRDVVFFLCVVHTTPPTKVYTYGHSLSLHDALPICGPETVNAVHACQKREFPGQYGRWDGRGGKNTLAKMSAKLPRATPEEGESIRQPLLVSTQSRCTTKGDRPSLTLPGIRRV